MQNSDIIKEFIKKEILKGDELRESIPLENNINLISEGIIDSYGLVNLMIFIERNFKIEIFSGNVNFDDFQTIDSICAFINKY